MLDLLFRPSSVCLSVLSVKWHAGAAGEVTFGWVLRVGVRVCAIRTLSGRGGQEDRVGRGVGCRGPCEVCLPFRVASSGQECAWPARADHALDALTLFLTRPGWVARRLWGMSAGGPQSRSL